MILADARVSFMELECFAPKADPAVVAISVRDTDQQHALAIWLTRESAQELVEYLERVA